MQKPVTSNIPRGVGCPPPPGMDPRKGKGKLMCIKVRMLDDSVGVFHLGHKATGQALFDEVCRHLNLLECDYFGLEFIDTYGNRCWLDKEKSILRQIMVAQSDARFFFVVKFYTPNPAELEEEYTRYLFALQIRRDLSRGELICSSESTAALLVALVVQSECGDFSPLDYPDASAYLAGTHFVPHQTPVFAQAVMEQHRRLIGMEPAEADFILLETARRCDFYGLRLHPARDIEGTEVALAVAHMGIKVFHQLNCVTTFSWAKVRKLSFKRKRLMIKVHPDSYQFYKETIEFSFENRDDCKNFWKKCVEHHSFFRCAEPIASSAGVAAKGGTAEESGGTASARKGQQQQQHHHHHHLFTRGSNFQYRGRTQKQLIDYVREHRKRREPFQRPLRRGNAVFAASGGTNSLGRTAQFLVSDRMPNEKMGNGNAQQQQQFGRVCRDETNFVCTFPSMGGGAVERNGGGSKGRPKSAVVIGGSAEKKNHHYHHQRGDSSELDKLQQQQQRPVAMQSSYHAGMVVPQHQQQQYHDGFRNGGMTAATIGGGGAITNSAQAEAAAAMALFHQHMDPMCMSMPNVLSTADADAVAPFGRPSQLTAAAVPSSNASAICSFLHSAHKSVSGENFHYAAELREDNQSEGSYRVGWRCAAQRRPAHRDDGGASSSSAASSQSDIVSAATSSHSPVDPRVYQTTFTTKRLGNVIMKRVMTTTTDGTTTTTAPGGNGSSAPPPTSCLSSASVVAVNASSSSSATASKLFAHHRRHPLQSRSAVDGTEPGDESASLASSSVAFSDYSLATTSGVALSSAAPFSIAPSTTTAAAATAQWSTTQTTGGRIRCTPSPTVTTQQQRQQFTTHALLPPHLRNEVPVLIDGPPLVNIVNGPGEHAKRTTQTTATTTTIIRPVLLPSPAATMGTMPTTATTANSLMDNDGRATILSSSSSNCYANIINGTSTSAATVGIGTTVAVLRRPSSASTASAASTPTQSTAVQRRPIVVATGKVAASPSPPPPPPILGIKDGGGQTTMTAQRTAKGGKQKWELMDNNGNVVAGAAIGGKPKVPPKPDLSALALLGEVGQQQQQQQQQHRGRKEDEVSQILAGPLESILKDVRSMNEALDVLESPTASHSSSSAALSRSVSSQRVGGAAGTAPTAEGQQQQQAQQRHRPPDAISVESDECPSVRTVHLFNTGDNRVPYTLTVRDLSASNGHAVRRKDNTGEQQQWHDGTVVVPTSVTGRSRTVTTLEGGQMPMIGAGGSGGGAPRHKSLELVQRRRLPPQGSFSSQDHSIAATSPDAGNVLEYVVAQRRRSASSERSSTTSSSATAQQNANKRSADRRQTQPVNSVGGGWPAKCTAANSGSEVAAAATDVDNSGKCTTATEKCVTADKMPLAEGREENSPRQKGDDDDESSAPQMLLETDF